MKIKTILGLNVRPQNMADFTTIMAKIGPLAPDIGVMVRPGDLSQVALPGMFSQLPRLLVYLVDPPLHMPARGCSIMVEVLPKHEQFLSFERAGVSTPRTAMIAPDLALDPAHWGERVVINPSSDSFGRGVALVHTELLARTLRAGGDELRHLLSRQYLVQAFVDSGSIQQKYRATVFLGEVILSYRMISRKAKALPNYSSVSAAIADQYFSSDAESRYQLEKNDTLNEFARLAYQANPDCPLQGLDIQCDESGKPYLIENNAGGNIWKFSDASTWPHKIFGPRRMIAQYGAWDLCARALAAHTRRLAL